MQRRFGLIGFLLVVGFAIVDVLSKWRIDSPVLLGIIIALGILIVFIERGSRTLATLVLFATCCFAIHLITLFRIQNAVNNWERIKEKEVSKAIDSSKKVVISTANGLLSTSERIGNQVELSESIPPDITDAFNLLSKVRLGFISSQRGGVAIADPTGEIISWAGRIPNSLDRLTTPIARRVTIRKGSGAAWFEAVSPIIDKSSQRTVGFSIAYLQVERLFGSEKSDGTGLLSELRKRAGYPVIFSTETFERDRDEDWLVSDVRMPSGEFLGYLKLRIPTVEDYLNRLKNQGLFIGSLLALLLMTACFVAILRWTGLTRPRLIDNQRLVAVIASIAGLRIGLAGLRENLALERLWAFTPVEYATQLATGILRSPADLALTGLAACVSAVVLLLVFNLRGTKVSVAGQKPSILIPHWLSLGAIASFLIAFGDRGLSIIHSDVGADLFLETGFHLSAVTLIRIGLAGLVATLLTICALIMREQMLLLKRTRFERFPVLLGLVIGLHFALALAFSGGRLTQSGFLMSILSIGFAVLLCQVHRKQIRISLVWIIVGLLVASSFVELPYGVAEHKRKSRIAAEAVASRIIYQTREWKSSIIEKASGEIESNHQIADLLADSKEGSHGIALNLWAKSVINRARVRGGIYVFSKADQIIDRFAPDEVGDISGIEAIIRGARLSAKRTTEITEAWIGRKPTPCYISVIPFYKDLEYVGSVVVVIPERYEFLAHDAGPYRGLLSGFPDVIDPSMQSEARAQRIHLSVIAQGKVIASTSADIEIGKSISEDGSPKEGEWFDQRFGGRSYRCYLVKPEGVDHGVLLSFSLPRAMENLAYGISSIVSYLLVATLVIAIIGLWRSLRFAFAKKGFGRQVKPRLGFTQKLALALVVVAVIPALILGSASRGFIRARLKEIMESKAEEGLNLARMALERVSKEDAERFAENPILMEALKEEPSLIVNLVKPGTDAVVFDSTGNIVASYGKPSVPSQILKEIISSGKTFSFFSSDDGLTAKSIFPIKDPIKPSRIIGCAFVSRTVDDRLARQLAVELGRQIDFFAMARLVASSSKEYFALELINDRIAPDAYVDCLLGGRDLCFSWQKVGKMDLVAAYAPLRNYDGSPVGAISAPLVFEKDATGVQMESTLSTIGHLVVILIWGVFLFGILLAKKISSPIHELIKGTMMVRGGNLDFEIPRKGDDEIADLISSFNEMTQALSRSRKALNERKRYMETILTNVGTGIISVDSRGKVEIVNPAAQDLLGIKEKDAKHKDCIKFLSKIGASGLADVLKEVSDRRGPIIREVTVQREGRGRRVFRAIGSSVSVKGRMMGKVIVFEDLTDLIRAKKLVAWNEMARQVAHEIKNPLTPMKLSIQHLIQCYRDKVEDLDKIVEETAQTIIDQIESLRKIALEFSRFSRLPERNPEIVDINSVVSEVLRQYESISSQGIVVETKLDVSLPSLRVDREEIKRLFINVIENAIDAMRGGGKLMVATRMASASQVKTHALRVTSRGEPEASLDEYVEVEISDTGTGIDEQSLSHIFEPNFSTKTRGAGLGLAICKGIVDGYDGDIVIETTPGKGTTVRIRLPLQEAREQLQARNRSSKRRDRYPQQ